MGLVKLFPDHPERLDKYLARVLAGHSRSKLSRLVDSGVVLVDGIARKPAFLVDAGMQVELEEVAETPPHNLDAVDISLDIRYEDEWLLVVNKPRGMPSHPSPRGTSPTLVNALLARNHTLSNEAGSFRPGIVHRLDKDTTGLMMVAKTDATHVHLARQIAEKTTQRRYVALIKGQPDQDRFKIDAGIAIDPRNRLKMHVNSKGKVAVTHYKTLMRMDEGTLAALKLETGRTHQIRVHLSAIGHPIKGDRLYAPPPWDKGALQLHAAWLCFDHPVRKESIRIFAEPPHDFIGRCFVSESDLSDWQSHV